MTNPRTHRAARKPTNQHAHTTEKEFPAFDVDSMSPGPAKRVIIIGAGLAGLSAAYILARLGHDVKVLEARNRPGGRVLTLRQPFTNGLYAEAGAELLPTTHPHTMGYTEMFRLSHALMPPSKNRVLYQVRGSQITNPDDPRAAWPMQLKPEERQLGLGGMWDKYFTSALPDIGNARAKGWPTGVAARWDKRTFSQFLRDRGASEGAIEILRLGYPDVWGDGSDVANALPLLRDLSVTPKKFPFGHTHSSATTSDLPRQNHFIRGGNDLLPRAFAESKELRGRIHYSAPVVRIEQNDLEIAAVCSGPFDPRRFMADRMICTIPFSVLRGVDLRLPISPGKRRAIERLQYTSVTRVWVQTQSPLWEASNLSGMSFSDLSAMFVYAPSHHLGGEKGLLQAHVSGRAARAMQAMGPAARMTATVNDFDELFPGVRKEFQCGRSICWDAEKWSRGAYPWFFPGEMADLMPHIAGAEGRLHIAGDHASVLPGWMQGAFESGQRAAEEVNRCPV